MKKDELVTRKMLSIIRESNTNANKEDKVLIKEEYNKDTDTYVITKNDVQFGDVRTAQEETFIKTVGEDVVFDDNALIYYPKENNITLAGKIDTLNLSFEFKYKDSGGDGCYISANSLQLTDTNNKTLGKIRSAFVNWKNSLLADGDLLARLHKISENH
ncbi:MAG: hypothetical protein IKT40_09050 [Bacilli bacterium]|nr:hypothetical protein [Bacilli bacterium]